MTAARRPVTVVERIARLVRPSQITVTGALIDTSAALSETEGKRAVAERRAVQLEMDVKQAQRERNAALDRAAIAERRLAEQIDIATRASNRHGLLNEPDLVAPGGTRDASLAAPTASEDHTSPTAPGASAR